MPTCEVLQQCAVTAPEETAMTDMPPIVAAFFKATQTDAVVACFTRDATVRDEHRQHRGIGEIEAWHRDTMARTPFTARPVSSTAG
jgi:hypothetical protein